MSMLDRAKLLQDEMSRLRRDIHAHPELAFQEVRTAALVAETLREIGGIDVRTNVGITGVVGSIGTGDGPPDLGVALRLACVKREIRSTQCTSISGFSYSAMATKVGGDCADTWLTAEPSSMSWGLA
jgi:hypothetical protein